MPSEKITFHSEEGHALDARLDLPDGEPVAFALFAHCFTCSKDVFAASRISRGLTQHGVGVLRFDFTGLGASEGEFANTNFSSNVEDLVCAAEYLRTTHSAPQLLIGHSLGGAAVLAAAAHVPEAVGVVTIGAPADPADVTHLFRTSTPEIEERGEVPVEIGGRTFTIKRQFLEDVSAQNLSEAIRDLGRALLVFHAPRDDSVAIDNARRIFEAAKHPKSFVSLDTADHLLTDRKDALYVAGVLAAWASRYIAGDEDDTDAEAPPGIERGTVLVTADDVSRFTQTITAGPHRLTADEPPGTGDDRGPTPYDLLLAGLGACTSMTLAMYARRKELPLDGVAVRLTYNRIHAKDCEECEGSTDWVHRIEREIELQGELSSEERERLLEIADRCPVHRTLTESKQILTRLAQ